LTRWAGLPLKILPLTPIAVSTLAGVIVSLLGTLGALLALYDLTKDELGQAGGLRTAFYLIIFPSGFFLSQVYTEGLFVGAAFGCLALLRRKQWLAAGALAVLATLTRAVGIALFIPLVVAWLSEFDRHHINRGTVLRTLAVAAPLAAYGAWHFSDWGQAFAIVEHVYFSRELFVLQRSLEAWTVAWNSFLSDNSQARVYYSV
jgi:Gpi18-like mannosyltransferase